MPAVAVLELDPGYPFVCERTEPGCTDPSGHLWASTHANGGRPEVPGAEPTLRCGATDVLTGRPSRQTRWDAWCTSFGSIISSHCVQPGCDVTRRRVIDFERPGEPEGDYMVYGIKRAEVGA